MATTATYILGFMDTTYRVYTHLLNCCFEVYTHLLNYCFEGGFEPKTVQQS